jgi:ribulose-phosphate 3-epimerase
MTLAPRELLRGVRVAPSILSADFARLREQVAEVLAAGARVIHVDVMDGHFVPAIAAGAMLDVHLMIERPERHVPEFVDAGAHSVTFHAEATPHLAYAAKLLHELGACVGVAINPATPAQALVEIAAELDLALCMTVNPGWGGQEFIAHSPGKVARVREVVGAQVALEVDGGIEPATAAATKAAGANLFVAGSAIFDAPDPAGAYQALAQAVGGE